MCVFVFTYLYSVLPPFFLSSFSFFASELPLFSLISHIPCGQMRVWCHQRIWYNDLSFWSEANLPNYLEVAERWTWTWHRDSYMPTRQLAGIKIDLCSLKDSVIKQCDKEAFAWIRAANSHLTGASSLPLSGSLLSSDGEEALKECL